MSFPYNKDLPNPPNNPSQDVGGMQENSQSIDAWVNVDHQGFNNPLGGQHSQVTFPLNLAQGSQANPASVLFTAQGTASGSNKSELDYKNQLGTFVLSSIKAFGVFATVTSGPVTLLMGFNVVSVTLVSSATYSIAITPGVINGTNVGVLTSNQAVGAAQNGWSYAANTLTIQAIGNGPLVTFCILQC